VKRLVAIVVGVTAGCLAVFASAACCEASSSHAVVLTPETAAKYGFSIECRFTEDTVTEGGNPPRPTGVLEVLVEFDANKGPEINRIHSVNISLRAGAKLVLGARVYLAPPPTEKRGTSLQFSIQKDWLPRCTLYLSEGGEGGPKSFVVDLNAFYKASERDQDAKWIRVWPAPGKSPYD
jgi:hypothetical protein